MSESISTSGAITVTQKIGLAVTGGGVTMSFIEQLTAGAQLIAALTGAIAGCWVLWDRWHDKQKKKRGRS